MATERYDDHGLRHLKEALRRLRWLAGEHPDAAAMADRLEAALRNELDERLRERASMFVPTDLQLSNARRWNRERGWGFTEDDFRSLGEPPPHILGNLLVAVVLEIRLETPARTFQELIAAAEERGSCRGVNPRIRFDDAHFGLSQGIVHARGLRWRVIDLGARWGIGDKIICELPPPERRPEAGILAALAHFPEWVRLIGDESVPPVYLTGYRVKIESDRMDVRPVSDQNHLVIDAGWRGDKAFFVYYDGCPMAAFHAVPEYVDA